MQQVNFDLPVRIRQGSWEALIPDAIFWLKTIAVAVTSAYGIKAGQKMAENDFDDIGLKTVFSKSLEAIQWVIRIGKHIGTIAQKKLADIVEEERILTVGLYKDGSEINETISPKYKNIFSPVEDEDVMFPELTHGMDVVLDGEVTRGNETTNSIGFRYNDHILTAYPKTGSVVRYKPTLFLKAKIFGTINRVDEAGKIAAKRPKIFFDDIVSEEAESTNLKLFE